MAGVKKRQIDEPVLNSNAWLTTFADLVMLLLTFFVLLLTMSSMDTKKMKEMFSHFQGTPGVLELSGETKITDLDEFVKKYQNADSLLVIDQALMNKMLFSAMTSENSNKKQIKKKLEKLEKLINITDDERGLVISFQGDILFDSGQAILKKEVFPFLNKLCKTIESFQNKILIMGHTDNMPVTSERYESNWELSLHRALSVLQYFLQEKNMDPSKFSVGGYGASKPLHSNDSAENRALNRRVEVILTF